MSRHEPDAGYLTTEQLAKRLGVSNPTVRNYFRDSRFPNPIKKYRGAQQYYVVKETDVAAFEKALVAIRNGNDGAA